MAKLWLVLGLSVLAFALYLPHIINSNLYHEFLQRIQQHPTSSNVTTTTTTTASNRGVTSTLEDVLRDFQKLYQNEAEPLPGHKKVEKVSIGYNTNVDLIIPAIPLLEKVLPAATTTDRMHLIGETKDLQAIQDADQLKLVFSNFFKTGSAAERFIDSQELFNSIVEEGMKLPGAHLFVGGNAALMAKRFADLKCEVLLGGAIGPKLRALLADYKQQITFAAAKEDDENQQPHDEVHIIMEYPKGATFGEYVAPRANRFIVARDFANSEFRSLEVLHSFIKTYSPDIHVISGFHLMDGVKPHSRRLALLREIQSHLASDIAPHIPIHLELASFGDTELLKEVSNVIFATVDSIGLNEQELETVYKLIRPAHCTTTTTATATITTNNNNNNNSNNGEECADASKLNLHVPDVVSVSRAMLRMFAHTDAIRAQQRQQQQQQHAAQHHHLSRIHFHALGFHCIAQRKIPGSSIQWTNTHQAVAMGSFSATTQACDFRNIMRSEEGDGFPLDGVELVFSLEQAREQIAAQPQTVAGTASLVSPSVLRWEQRSTTSASSSGEVFEFFLSPLLVCKRVVKTVGLGDSISASALSRQHF